MIHSKKRKAEEKRDRTLDRPSLGGKEIDLHVQARDNNSNTKLYQLHRKLRIHFHTRLTLK